MKADEAGTVLKIADFIGETTSRDRATEIASLTTFNKMKKVFEHIFSRVKLGNFKHDE